MDHTQVLGNLVIGGSYVPEQHSEIGHYLPRPEKRSFAMDFHQMLKSLRAALSLH